MQFPVVQRAGMLMKVLREPAGVFGIPVLLTACASDKSPSAVSASGSGVTTSRSLSPPLDTSTSDVVTTAESTSSSSARPAATTSSGAEGSDVPESSGSDGPDPDVVVSVDPPQPVSGDLVTFTVTLRNRPLAEMIFFTLGTEGAVTYGTSD